MRVQSEVEVTDVEGVRRIMESTNARHAEAFNRGDVAGFARVYAEDARILPPDAEPIDGRAAIEQFWAGAARQLGIRDLRLISDEVEVLGERAYEQGRFEFMTGQGPARGKFIVVWRREPDGEWRWHRDIWNLSPARPG
jgi:ketosteroid isomerase-like protein